MSNLENELDAARGEYESLRYPGDLAAQLLPSRPGRWRWAVAAAAAIILLAIIAPHANGPGDEPADEPGPIAHRPTAPAELTEPTFTRPMMPDVSLADMPSVTAVPISMPSMADVPDVSLDLSGFDL